MKRGLDWYKREPVAFLDGVQGMGPDLIGAYAVLLDLLYARAGEMPRDDRHLAGILGCSLRKSASLTEALIARGKITVEGDFIVNSRAKSDAKSRRNVSETRAKAGRSGGEKSATARKNNDLRQPSASSKTQPEKRRGEIREESPLTPRGENGWRRRVPEDTSFRSDEFIEFKSLYPTSAYENDFLDWQAWLSLTGDEREAAVAAAPLFQQNVRKRDPEKTPTAANWLKQRAFWGFVRRKQEEPEDVEVRTNRSAEQDNAASRKPKPTSRASDVGGVFPGSESVREPNGLDGDAECAPPPRSCGGGGMGYVHPLDWWDEQRAAAEAFQRAKCAERAGCDGGDAGPVAERNDWQSHGRRPGWTH